MADDDGPSKPRLEHRLGDRAQRVDGRVAGLVDVEVEVEAARRMAMREEVDGCAAVRSGTG